jgi:predicted ATPase
MARKPHVTALPAPFLQRILLVEDRLPSRATSPFNLPWRKDPEFELTFPTPITIIVGANGTGKSTLIEALAALSGYDEAGGGKGYNAVDDSRAVKPSGSALAEAFRASWLPKVTNGWFFRAESFFTVARYHDTVGSSADFLSHSHGEGFLRLFDERMSRQGIYFLDEPESALSPKRQLELLRLLNRIQQEAKAQVLQITRHFRLYQDFTSDPEAFVAEALADTDDRRFQA